MQENRRLPRKIVNESIRILDLNSGQYLGQLVNINDHGLLLASEQPIVVHLVYQLEMVLAQPHWGTDRISFGAESMWHRHVGDNNRYWTGFQIIDISDESALFIQNLTAAWETDA